MCLSKKKKFSADTVDASELTGGRTAAVGGDPGKNSASHMDPSPPPPLPPPPRDPNGEGRGGGEMPYQDADSRLRALAGRAEGFGRHAIGGLHGAVYHVTSLQGTAPRSPHPFVPLFPSNDWVDESTRRGCRTQRWAQTTAPGP